MKMLQKNEPIDLDVEKTFSSCPVCQSGVIRWRSKKTAIGCFDIDRCTSCKYAFVNPRPSIKYLMEYYSSSGHSPDGSESVATLDSILKQEQLFPNSTMDATRMIKTIRTLLGINQSDNSSFLDVGCGYGFFSKEAIDSGFEVVALEMADTERKIAEQIINFQPLGVSFEEFEWEHGAFSAVLMSQILEHAHDPAFWVTKAHDLLKTGGVLAIALPNFRNIFRFVMQENEPYICPPAHLNYYDANNLALLLKNNGFEIQKVEWISRILPTAFEKRFPFLGKSGLATVNQVAKLALNMIDKAHLGIFVNVYAKKI